MKTCEIFRQTLRNIKKLNEKEKDIFFTLTTAGQGKVPEYMKKIGEQEGFVGVKRNV